MMRIKQRALIITFDATTAAMAAERLCLQTGLPGGLPDARRQKNNKITVLFYQMNVNKPWIYHRKVLRG